MEFKTLKTAVEQQFEKISTQDLFVVGATKDEMWDTYLGSFPTGSNPIFRERTEHDCSCCRHFIRDIGNLVAIVDGKMVSVWDFKVGDKAYQAVADAMSALIKSKAISHPFLYDQHTAGVDKNFEHVTGTAGATDSVRTWTHFHVKIPHARNQGRNFYSKRDEIPTKLGEYRALHDVLLRSLTELSLDSVDTVLELISQNSLYRGNEHEFAVKEFRKLKVEFLKLPAKALDLYVWSKIEGTAGSVSKIRNTSIGTLLVDLSEGMELEEAVRKFEKVVAPDNYKRPTALVTPAMVAKAKTEIEKLGLTSALERRYANLADISVNNIIFADRQAQPAMKDAIFDDIATKKAKPKNLDKVEEIHIEKFIKDVVPNVESIEVLFDNKFASNLVSLIAPVHKDALPLFKWDNNFSWSYNGDVADSLKERVKRAGGNVTGDLCCRLAWSNHDDLDFHMKEAAGFEIAFHSKKSLRTGGQLDVDMNAGYGQTREPVENIFYGDRRKMVEGKYELFVHQYMKRESTNVGFEAEIAYLGEVTHFTCEKALRLNDRILIANLHYSHKKGLEIDGHLPSTTASRTLWGVPTQEYRKANLFMLSPNHWDGQGVGNRHYFFMLEGCVNDGQARGFFNEFLRPELATHRKVIEIVGSKMKTAETTNQLSGLGFSDTKRAEVTVRVKGNFTRVLKVLI